jgi:ferredoxin--NADP+ reductase
VPFPGLPFDDRRGVVPNEGGRVVRDGEPVPGEYVAGWIKRGPTGVIGTNKHDAAETTTALLADLPSLPAAPDPDPDAVVALLESRGVRVVVWDGWRAIDDAEAELGRAQGRKRVKISDRATLLETAARADGQGRVIGLTSDDPASSEAESRSRVPAATRESAAEGAPAP